MLKQAALILLLLCLDTPLSGASESLLPHNTTTGNVQHGFDAAIHSVLKDASEDSKTVSLRRHLEAGDFAAFNQLFTNVKINLPDEEVSKKIIFNTFRLSITELQCQNISVNDVQVTYTKLSDQNATFDVNVVGLSVNCFGHYNYDWGFIDGNGGVQAYTSDNNAQAQLGFNSPSFDTEPPTNATINSCSAQLNIYDLNFDGRVVAAVLNTAESLVRNAIEGQIEGVICSELSSLGTKFISDAMTRAAEKIDKYLLPVDANRRNPLFPEQNMTVPPSVKLLNFSDLGNTIGSWVNGLMGKADQLFGGAVDDPGGPTGTNQDLGINVMLRDMVLDKNRSITIKTADLPFDNFDPVLFESNDIMTESTLSLDSVRIFGLDSFTVFKAFRDIGNYTLQNEFQWKFLNVELALTLNIKPSTKDDAILVDSDPNANVVEKFTVSVGLDELAVVASVLLAIDQDKLGALDFGSLLRTKSIASCLLSTIYEAELSGLAVSVGNIQEPVLRDFISPGIDHLVTTAVEAVFSMYEPTLLRAIPGIFQGPVRKILQKQFIGTNLSNSDKWNCPIPDSTGGNSLDFRDFLLKPSAAVALGASGKEPYGDVGHIIYGLIQDHLSSTAGSPSPINDYLIRPITEKQSGVAGTFRRQDDLVSFVENDIDFGKFITRFEIKLSNFSASNLDSVVSPLTVLMPTTDAYSLNNSLSLNGNSTKPLELAVNLYLGINSSVPSLNMNDNIEVSVSLSSIGIVADLLMQMATNSVLHLPIRYLLNPSCWLATMAGQESTSPHLAIRSLITGLKDLQFNARCILCASNGTSLLPEIMSLIALSGAVDTLQSRLESLVSSVANSSATQSALGDFVTKSAVFCPLNANYDANATNRTGLGLTLSSLSAESVDTFLYAASLLAEVGFIVAVENHRMAPAVLEDALSSQEGLEVAEGVRLLNFENLGESLGLGSIADRGLKELRSYLGSASEDGGLRINGMLATAAKDDGVVELNFDNVDGTVGDFYIAFRALRVKGLDSFTEFNILQPVAPQTLRNTVRLERVNFEFDVVVDILSTDDPPQTLTFSFSLNGIVADVALFAALDLDMAGNISLGSLLRTREILPCFISAMESVNIPLMNVTIGSFDYPEIKGLLTDTSASVASSIQALIDRFRSDILEAIPKIFSTTVRAAVNEVIYAYVADPACPNLGSTNTVRRESVEPLSFIDLRDLLLNEAQAKNLGGSGLSPYGDLFRSIVKVVKDNLLAEDSKTGTLQINSAIIARVTEAQSNQTGSLLFNGDLFNQGKRINVGGLDARIVLKVYDAYVANLDTVGSPISLLDPVDNSAYSLMNKASVGVDRALRMGTRFLIGISGDDSEISNNLDINLDLHTITILATALLKVATDSFFTFPLRDFNKGACWIALMPAPQLDETGVRIPGQQMTFALTDLVASVLKLNLNITCIECSSPGMSELSRLLSTPEADNDATAVANKVLDYAAGLLGGEYLQVKFDRMLNDAQRRCPHAARFESRNASATVYEPFEAQEEAPSLHFFLVLVIVVGVLLLALAATLLTVKSIVRRRNIRWVSRIESEKLLVLASEQHLERRKMEALRHGFAMWASPAIPKCVRLTMPFLILANIGFFLSGHLNLGASVNIEANLAGQAFKVENFYSFSILRSITEIWNAGGQELAIFILVCSVLWPYTKQIMTLVLWFMPPSIVTVSKRESIFLWLDALGKWSMVDIFVLVVMIAGFRVSVHSPSVGFLPDNFYALDLLVVPKWGLYANMIAQLICQINSHVIIHYHRRVREQEERALLQSENLEDGIRDDIRKDDRVYGLQNDREERLCKHAFARPHRGEADKVVACKNVNFLAICVAALVVLLIVLGCSLPSFSLEIYGIVGVLVESGQRFRQAHTNYSVFTMIGMLLDQARFTGRPADFIGLGSLSILIVLTVLLVPIMQSVLLLYAWLRPLGDKRRHRVAILIEILHAWEYAEVYLLAVVVASWQLGQVSDFMINSYCENLKDFFAQMVYYGVLDKSDAQCFRVESRVESASFILAAGAVLLSLLNSFVMKAITQYFREKDASYRSVVSDIDFAQDEDEIRKSITPPPVLFTDSFRWFLLREDAMLSRNVSQMENSWGSSDGEGNDDIITNNGDEGAAPTSSANDLIADTMADAGKSIMIESLYADESDSAAQSQTEFGSGSSVGVDDTVSTLTEHPAFPMQHSM